MMDDDAPGPEASPTGIAECIRMLAEEAASLRLVRTLLALLETLEICQVEAMATKRPAAACVDVLERPALLVH